MPKIIEAIIKATSNLVETLEKNRFGAVALVAVLLAGGAAVALARAA